MQTEEITQGLGRVEGKLSMLIDLVNNNNVAMKLSIDNVNRDFKAQIKTIQADLDTSKTEINKNNMRIQKLFYIITALNIAFISGGDQLTQYIGAII